MRVRGPITPRLHAADDRFGFWFLLASPRLPGFDGRAGMIRCAA
jgi:hypothetical protein